MRVLLLIPTTGGPLLVRGLKPRPGLPSSAAFADGDYRPLPWSADYARLSAPGGPLARLTGDAEPHELRLSRGFDTGRSWEVPVSLGHGLLAHGHTIVADPAEADLVLWATGAVDLDLALIAGDYALLDKVELSRDLAAQAGGVPLVAVLPPGRDHAEAGAALAALWGPAPVRRVEAGTIAAALSQLTGASAAEPERSDLDLAMFAAPPVRPRRGMAVWISGLVVFGGAAAAAGYVLTTPAPVVAPKPVEQAAVVAPEPPKPPPAPPRLVVEELRAPKGSSCRRVAFGADKPDIHAVPPADDKGVLPPGRLDADLCGLAFHPSGGAADHVSFDATLLAASLPPSTASDGTVTVMLREDLRRNVVYSAQVAGQGGGVPQTFTQELRP